MLKLSTIDKIDELLKRYPALEICRDDLNSAVAVLCEGFRGGHKLLTCGNGGSAADSMHIVGELMKGSPILMMLNILLKICNAAFLQSRLSVRQL